MKLRKLWPLLFVLATLLPVGCVVETDDPPDKVTVTPGKVDIDK